MKKILLLALCALFAAPNSVNAQFNGQVTTGGGFTGPRSPSVATMTVEQSLSVGDDTVVVVRGKIINSLGDEKYMFGDETGQVIIEIDDEDWHGVTVSPEDTLEIVGKMDKDFMEKTKIDVSSFTIVK